MAKRKTSSTAKKSTGATVGYEAQLWQMADALRGSMDAAEYKHVVLGLIFLKYISDAFEERHARLEAQRKEGADPEDPDEYKAANIFWVPPEARWSHLKHQAKQPTIGRLVDDAMDAIERDNPALKDVLPKDYARPALDKTRLGQLIDLVSNIRVGDDEARSKDVLGRMVDRTHRKATDDEEIPTSRSYHASSSETDVGDYEDVRGFFECVTLLRVPRAWLPGVRTATTTLVARVSLQPQASTHLVG